MESLGDARLASLLAPKAGEQLVLSQMSVSEGLSMPFHCDITAQSEDDSIDLASMLGKVFSVEWRLKEGTSRYFSGVLTTAQYLGRPDGDAVYQLIVEPFFSLLSRTSDCRIFQHQTVPDIVKQVLQEQGFGDVELRLSNQYQPWEYCVQYRETLLDFIQRILEHEGIYYFFEHELDRHVLILADHQGAHGPIEGQSSIPFLAPGSDSALLGGGCFQQWQHAETICSGRYALRDYDLERPRNDLSVQAQQVRGHEYADLAFYDYPGHYQTLTVGEGYAKHRLQSLQQQYEVMSGSGNALGLSPGRTFTMEKHLRQLYNQEYLVISVSHQLSIGGYRSGSEEAFSYQNTVQSIPFSTPYRPAIKTLKPVVEGIQTAVVTGPSGEEIWTDELGRVVVQFHWDRLGAHNENSTCWVPVSHQWAGKQWGVQFLPRIGDEVIVSFIEGNPDRPIITGRLYHGQNKPIYELPSQKTQSGIKTHSTPGGLADQFNEIRFEDQLGSEELSIQAQKDHRIQVKNDQSIKVGRYKTETVGINSAETIGVAKELTTGGLYQVTVGGMMNETVAAAKAEEVGLTKNVLVGLNMSESVAGEMTVSVGKDRSVTVTEASTHQAKQIAITAEEELSITVGKAQLIMKEDGTIQLSGNDIEVSGSGGIAVKASNNIVLKGKKIQQN